MILQTRLIALSLIFLAACHHTKKTNTTVTKPEEETVELDTLTVLANKNKIREEYQGSNTRLNDILHTKLEVNFDWKSCRMNGIATIRLKPYFRPVDWLYLNARGMEIKKVDVFEIKSITEKIKTAGKIGDVTREELNHLSRAAYIYENDSIKINFGQTFSDTENYYVVID